MSTIKGRLTKDAELKELESGSTVVNFTVAVNDSYEKRNGEKVDRVEYFNCAYWFDADIATKLLKGVLVDVSGWIGATVYEKNGEQRAQLTMQVQCVKFPFVSKKKDVEGAEPPAENRVATTNKAGKDGKKRNSGKGKQPSANRDEAGDNDSLPF